MRKKAKKSVSPIAMAAFKTFNKDIANEQKRAIWKYVNKFVTQAFKENNTKAIDSLK